jgi:hypothetical protein
MSKVCRLRSLFFPSFPSSVCCLCSAVPQPRAAGLLRENGATASKPAQPHAFGPCWVKLGPHKEKEEELKMAVLCSRK